MKREKLNTRKGNPPKAILPNPPLKESSIL